jgi:membrane complex biogenesis BtpA family protein
MSDTPQPFATPTPMKPVGANSRDALRRIFGREKPVIGVVHLAPLPGSPRHEGGRVEAIYERGLADAHAYLDGGCDGVIVENHGDVPFSKPDDIGPETAAHMAVVSDRIRRAFAKPVGINVLANAAIPALAVASAAGAAFIRVNQWANAYVANEGLIEGEAARALRYRARLRANGIAIFADAHVKHGAHAIVADRPVEEQVRDLAFFDADAIIATGQRTGHAADLDYIRLIKNASHLPTLVGSGVTPDNAGDILSMVDGVIVASALKQDGVWWNTVDPNRVKDFMARLRR